MRGVTETMWAVQRSLWSVVRGDERGVFPRPVVVSSVILLTGMVFYIAVASRVLIATEAIGQTNKRLDFEGQRLIELTSELEAMRSPLNLQQWAKRYSMVPTTRQNVWKIP